MFSIISSRPAGKQDKEPELTCRDEPIEDLAIGDEDTDTINGGIIVVGSRGHNPISGLLVGSVSYR
jgi:nucleotide-binding universal stress UspA family protein